MSHCGWSGTVLDTPDTLVRSLLVERISKKFAAWNRVPHTKSFSVFTFLDPLLMEHFPKSPTDAIMPKMLDHIYVSTRSTSAPGWTAASAFKRSRCGYAISWRW